MKKQRSLIWAALPIFLIGITLFALQAWRKSKLNVGAAYLLSYQSFENNYRSQFGSYAPSANVLRDSIKLNVPSEMSLYLDQQSLPEKLRLALPSEWLPTVSVDGYSILLAVAPASGSLARIWRVSDSTAPQFQDVEAGTLRP